MKILIGYDGSTHADIAIDDLQRAGLPQKAEAIVLSAVEWPTLRALRSWGMIETDFSPEWIERLGLRDSWQRPVPIGCRTCFRNGTFSWNLPLEIQLKPS